MKCFPAYSKPKWISILTVVWAGSLLLSACDTRAQETSDMAEDDMLLPATTSVLRPVNIAADFKGFYVFKAAENLSGSLGGLQESVKRVLDGLGYSSMSAKDGVETTLDIDMLVGDDFILDFILENIPDDLAKDRNLRILFEKTSEGYKIKHMGVRERCVYGAYQTEWTMGSCPDQAKALLEPLPKIVAPTPVPVPVPMPAPAPIPEPAPISGATQMLILQDGVDAFAGYKNIDIPTNLNDVYPNQGKAIVAFIMAFDLRTLANTEGVSAWAKIRTSAAGETTWQYEIAYLPDDSVYASDYKIYLEKVIGGYKISRIGHRVKCYRGDNPKQWTVELCP